MPPRLVQTIQEFIKLFANDAEVDDANPLPVNVQELEGLDPRWSISLQSDETLNDSDKSFTVPANTQWHVLWVWVEYASDATVGDRQLVIEIQDSASDVIAQLARAGTTQAANLTRYYQFAPSLADLTNFRDTNYLTTPLPPTLVLQAGDVVRVYDNNVVAVAGDDMIVQMQVGTRGM